MEFSANDSPRILAGISLILIRVLKTLAIMCIIIYNTDQAKTIVGSICGKIICNTAVVNLAMNTIIGLKQLNPSNI